MRCVIIIRRGHNTRSVENIIFFFFLLKYAPQPHRHATFIIIILLRAGTTAIATGRARDECARAALFESVLYCCYQAKAVLCVFV